MLDCATVDSWGQHDRADRPTGDWVQMGLESLHVRLLIRLIPLQLRPHIEGVRDTRLYRERDDLRAARHHSCGLDLPSDDLEPKKPAR